MRSKQQVMLCTIGHLEEDRERSNTVIFGLEENVKERFDDALEVANKDLEETVRLVFLLSNNDHITSLQEEEASSLYL